MQIRVTAFAARRGVSKSSQKPYFQQMLEIRQDGRPSAQLTRFASDEQHVLAAGDYTATVNFYPKQFKNANGFTSTELVASLYDFVPVK